MAALAAAALVATGAGTAASSAAPVAGAPLQAQASIEVDRIAGANRYETAALIAQEFPAPVDTVFIASGAVFADALSARPAATAVGPAQGPVPSAPILLTAPGGLPTATVNALTDLAPTTVRIVGGEQAVSPDVEAAIKVLLPDATVQRIGGEDRYVTSARIARQFPRNLERVYIASGADFPDALAGGAVATRDGVPVLLTRPNALPSAVAGALGYLNPTDVVILGGPTAVNARVEAEIKEIVPNVSRIYGADRYATAAKLAQMFPKDAQTYLASGVDFPDALTGAALAGTLNRPLLLTRPGSLAGPTLAGLNHISPQGVTILGGTGAVSGAVAAQVAAESAPWAADLNVQLLAFNDYHGNLEAGANRLTPAQDPEQHLVGGVEYLSTTLKYLRKMSLPDQTLTVTAGDLVGGSPFLSGLFHDEPSIESLNEVGLDISSVGNHEFDEGTAELLRIQNGGCHPVDGCYFPEEPYAGADFQYLAANVVYKEGEPNAGESILPGTEVRTIDGVQVGFIGMTLEETPTLVAPGGVATVDFLDEVETANAAVVDLQAQGVETIVVLIHEGGAQPGHYNGCDGISGPIVEIAEQLDPAIDAVISGHTHMPYICTIDDPDGQPRLVTSANQYGRVVTEMNLVIDRASGDVDRARTAATNHLVLQSRPADPTLTQVIDKWSALADIVGAQVVGTVAEDITGDASGDRGIETPMGNLIADAILWGMNESGAESDIAFMNVGGIRASFRVNDFSHNEGPGEITYAEAFAVAPFNNLLVRIDMTGDQIRRVLEQQYDPNRGRPYLHIAGSQGLTYTWDDSQPQGQKVSNLELNGVPIDPEGTYRVATLNFLQEGGDSFSVFTEGTNLTGGPEDLQNLVEFLKAHPDLTAPATDRVEVPNGWHP
jgi:5'-nucleotidase